MRTITRTGVTLSVVAVLALYGVQLIAALGVALGVIVTGALAGLGVAKWLERGWYGRQFGAGARAGAIACGVGGLSALLYLLGQGPRSVAELAVRSHVPGVDLAPLVLSLSGLGWAGIDATVMLAAIVAGTLTSALIALIAGWSKSGKAVRVVAQARLAAQALQRGEARSGVTAGPRTSGPGTQLYATGAPASAPALDAGQWEGLGLPGSSAPKRSRTWRPAAPALQPAPAPSPRPAGVHRPSDARSRDEALTDETRIALSSWADELDEFDDADQLTTEKVRTPNPSTFLTSPPPIKPRKRKKQNTGDWLC